MFPISYRDLELMLQDRGVEVAHTFGGPGKWLRVGVSGGWYQPPKLCMVSL
jgi:hypothetical protein